MKEEIRAYISNNYSHNTPILTSDIKDVFPHVKEGTIRQILRRLKTENYIKQTGPGTYFIPKEVGILNKAQITAEQVIKKKYLFDEQNGIIGYERGFNLANELGLSTQTSHIVQIASNSVSDKKRKINIHNRVIIIDAPRILITEYNYRILQILDILNDFDKYSEVDFFEAKTKILGYLKNTEIKKEELHDIVEKYPVRAQLMFYKLGDINGITS